MASKMKMSVYIGWRLFLIQVLLEFGKLVVKQIFGLLLYCCSIEAGILKMIHFETLKPSSRLLNKLSLSISPAQKKQWTLEFEKTLFLSLLK